MVAELVEDPRLTPMEALMWRLEADRRLSANFGAVVLLDQAPDRDRLRKRLLAACSKARRLRCRITGLRLPLGVLSWEPMPDFDIDDHLHWVEGPLGLDEVLAMAARAVAERLEAHRPLWDVIVVAELEGGGAALLHRMHHSVTDGQGGLQLLEQLVDGERDAPDPVPDPFVGDDSPPPEADADWLDRAALAASERLSELAGAAAALARWAAGQLTEPEKLSAAGREAIETVKSLARQVAVLDGSRSQLWDRRGESRCLVIAKLPFAPVREAATKLAVSINDVFITAVLRGAASYHRAKGELLDEARVAIPVSTRREGTAAQNAFSPTRVVLPTGEGVAVAEHLQQVCAVLGQTKNERTTALVEPLAAVAELVPWPLLSRLMLQQTATIDISASNVRGVPIPLFLAGSRLESLHAVGPLVGTPANVTMISYAGHIDLGINVDTDAIEDAELLRDSLVSAFEEIVEEVLAEA